MQALEQGTLDIGLIGAEDDMSAFVFEPLTDIQDIFVTTHTYLDNLKERIRPNDHLSSRTAFAASTLLLLNKENITKKDLEEVKEISKSILVAIAVFIGKTRLIDNFTYEL